MANSGWGDGAWGSSFWGGFVDADVSVTGLSATSAVGEEGVTGTSVVVETGLEATGVVNSAGLTFLFAFLTSSVSATGAVGNLTVLGDSNFAETGVAGTTVVGSESVTAGATVSATGVSATTALGNVLPTIPITAVVTGVSATIGFMTGWGNDGWGAGVWGGGVFADVGQTIVPTSLEATATASSTTQVNKVSFEALADAQISTAQSKFSGSSLELDGTADRIQSSKITLGTDDYTWETFVRFDTLSSSQCIWDAGQNVGASQNPVVYITSSNLQLSYAGGTYINQAHGMSTNTWHHIAIVRNGTQLQAFIDGTSIGTATIFANLGSGSTNHVIGGNFAGTNTTDGYFDETRLTKRVIYSSNFTPPTSELTADSADLFLLKYDGANGSTTITNDAPLIGTFITGTSIFSVTGVAGTTALGDALAGAGARVVETGLTGTIGFGDESVVGTALVAVTGNAGTTALGNEFISTATGAPVTTVLGTTALGEETVFAGADIAVTLAGLTISLEDVAISGSSVLSLTGVSGTASTGEEQVYSLIVPDQLANWLERAA